MRRILNSRGLSFIEILLTIGIILTVMAGGASIVSSIKSNQKRAQAITSVVQYRRSIIETLRSSDSLAKSGALNSPQINCFIYRQNCGPGNSAAPTNWADFSLYRYDYTPTNNRILTSTNPNFGFNLAGDPCTTYPSEACPFRYELQWKAICGPGTCEAPQIKAKGELKIFDRYSVAVNTSAQAFEITLGQSIGNYEESCVSVGGTYVPGPNPGCTLPADGPCLPAANGQVQYVYGYDRATKTKMCRAVLAGALCNQSCAPGNVIIGTDGAGCPVCVPIKPNPCPGPPNTCAYVCQINPLDPRCVIDNTPSSDGGGGSGDGGCGAGDGC
jgi:type II secretory pathway pseudopilin PulG